MAVSHGISASGRRQTAPVIPQQNGLRYEVLEMFKAALALAHDRVIIGGDTARCASCRAVSATGDELDHSIDCEAGRVLRAYDALKHTVSRKPAVSTSYLADPAA